MAFIMNEREQPNSLHEMVEAPADQCCDMQSCTDTSKNHLCVHLIHLFSPFKNMNLDLWSYYNTNVQTPSLARTKGQAVSQ